ncbi:MAG: substrate-binding domain-containing protein, partial [Firmicutes bacterium]|nr:substrate-binding domain-containing protein [Bacillota bacterium]
MNRKILALLLIFVMCFALTACGSTDEGQITPADTTLTMATTTSTDNTGLLDYLQPLFLEDTGITLEWTAVGTGEAIAMGASGDVDIILVHAKASEEEFVASGAGVERFPVMYNDYIIVGPDAENTYGDDLEGCLKAIAEGQLPFVSRGDDSGTHKAELKLWKAFEMDYAANPNYAESGQGMGATIAMADEMQAYCMTDRGTWLSQKKNTDMDIELEIVCQGAKNLLNQYGVIAVNPEYHEGIDINNEAANAFIEWI